MTPPKVWNKRIGHAVPEGAVYVGRPSKWGNPFTIGRDGDRAEVFQRYREYLMSNDGLLDSLIQLRG
jgi:hypothetical protein